MSESDRDIKQIMGVIDRHEAPFVAILRNICDEIGYGHVIQIVEGWMEEKHPGWLTAKRKVIREGRY